MANLILVFKNGSESEWYQDQNSHSEFDQAGYSIQEWPDAPLLPMTGSGTCNIGMDLDHVAETTNSFWYCWNNKSWRFGVKVTTHLQMLSMGGRPTWQVMSDQNLNNPSITWKDNGDSPGDQYSWPDSIGYSIVATPTSSHDTITITVQIEDLPA